MFRPWHPKPSSIPSFHFSRRFILLLVPTISDSLYLPSKCSVFIIKYTTVMKFYLSCCTTRNIFSFSTLHYKIRHTWFLHIKGVTWCFCWWHQSEHRKGERENARRLKNIQMGHLSHSYCTYYYTSLTLSFCTQQTCFTPHNVLSFYVQLVCSIPFFFFFSLKA